MGIVNFQTLPISNAKYLYELYKSIIFKNSKGVFAVLLYPLRTHLTAVGKKPKECLEWNKLLSIYFFSSFNDIYFYICNKRSAIIIFFQFQPIIEAISIKLCQLIVCIREKFKGIKYADRWRQGLLLYLYFNLCIVNQQNSCKVGIVRHISIGKNVIYRGPISTNQLTVIIGECWRWMHLCIHIYISLNRKIFHWLSYWKNN